MSQSVVECDGVALVLDPGRTYRLGCDPASDLVVGGDLPSASHAGLRFEGGQWILEDADSQNGTYLGEDRVQRVDVKPGIEVRLGDASTGPLLRFSEILPAPVAAPVVLEAASDLLAAHEEAYGTAPQSSHLEALVGQGRTPALVKTLGGARTLRIGRDEDNDIVVENDLKVSHHHAELRSSGGAYEIVDLGSSNGTYVNGQHVQRAEIRPQDIVGIGNSTFHLVGDVLMQFVDTGAVSL
ncbi:MAG TPA: FHA domain-containing protein, partial [Streptosporangiaceae bacterium]|nr:FHA domain-containing protein [Streptosporangiaceae bacterium]